MGGSRDRNRAFEDGGGADAPYARPAQPIDGKPDQLADKLRRAESRQEALLDEAIEETFPGSDPISPKRLGS